MGIFSKAKAKLEEIQAAQEQIEIELKRKQLQAVTLVGEQYPCRKDRKRKRRDAEKTGRCIMKWRAKPIGIL